MTIATSELTLDPGTGFAGVTKNYKVSVATPNHLEANGGISNPKEFLLNIEFRNECRDMTIDNQILSMMEIIVGDPAVT